MPKPAGVDSDPHWDEVVDVICVGPGSGSGLGSLAYGIACAEAGRDVLLVGAPSEPDPVLAGLLAAMTEDLGDPSPDTAIAVGSVVPESASPAPEGRTNMKSQLAASLEPFVGQQLRSWSAQCLASPYGVMFTEVPDLLIPMRTDAGDLITAAVLGDCRESLSGWLLQQAGDHGLTAADRLIGLVVEGGRIVGAILDTSCGPLRVGATAGIAVSVGPPLPEPPGPTHAASVARFEADLEFGPEIGPEIGLGVAVVGRRFGRFARVEMFRQ